MLESVDTLDDEWRSHFSTDMIYDRQIWTAEEGSTNTKQFTLSGVTVTVSMRNMTGSTLLGESGSTMKAETTASLQDRSPKPASLSGTAMINETTGKGDSLNGMFFDFSEPVEGF